MYITYDNSYLFWDGACRADSPLPKIVFKYVGNEYHLAPEYMQTEGLDPNDLNMSAKEFRNATTWVEESLPPIGLVDQVINLLYGGHVSLAWELLDKSWPASIQGKESYAGELRTVIEKGPFYEELYVWWT
jgi:hypothetical protein